MVPEEQPIMVVTLTYPVFERFFMESQHTEEESILPTHRLKSSLILTPDEAGIPEDKPTSPEAMKKIVVEEMISPITE